jgi:hypothetical protein
VSEVEFHHASSKHLDRYVSEFTFRLNDGDVARHTLDRIASLLFAVADVFTRPVVDTLVGIEQPVEPEVSAMLIRVERRAGLDVTMNGAVERVGGRVRDGNYILESRSYRFRPSRRACDGNEQIAKRFGRGRCFFPRESALVPILSPLVIEADLMRPAQA